MDITTTLYVPQYLLTKEDLKSEIIHWFNNALKYNTFMFGSKENIKYIGYGYQIPYELLTEIAVELSEKTGLNISYGLGYYAGPFNALIINTGV